MIQLKTLDTVIAVVVVVLVLSLVVQSIQAVVKKVFKLKSRQIEIALKDLFQNVLGKTGYYTAPVAGGEAKQVAKTSTALQVFQRMAESSPVYAKLVSPVRWLLEKVTRQTRAEVHPDVKALYNDVLDKFQDIGRTSQFGGRVLNSIAKDDLLKVLEKVLPKTLLPTFDENFQALAGRARALLAVVDGTGDSLPAGPATGQFAALRQALTPFLSRITAVAPPAADGSVTTATPTTLIQDILRLPDVRTEQAFKLLTEVQARVDEQRVAPNVDAATIEAAKAAAAKLKELATAMGDFATGLDDTMGMLRDKLREVETWYDTVMQSFEERYDRSMKTWALVIGFAVVAALNANLINIYQGVAASDTQRAALLQYGPQALANSRPEAAAEPKADAKPPIAPAKSTTAGANEAPPAAAPKANPAPTTQPTIEDVRKAADQAVAHADVYRSLGFEPLNRTNWQNWKERYGRGIGEGLRHDVGVLLGWLLMACLLALGAPFWHDALESLFGVKALLQKRGNARNVESASGAGKTKTGT